MTSSRRRVLGTSLALLGAWFVVDGTAQQPAGGQAPDRVAALKQSMATSQKQLRQYEWIETTTISMKGEEKSRKQQRCYYGADGKIQKLPVDSGQAAAPAKESGGGRRRGGGKVKESIVENKKEEISDYMKEAVALVHQYVPPNPELIEKAKAAGKVATKPGAAGQVGLDINDYLKPGDRLTVNLDSANNRLLGINIASYLEKPDDVVTLAVQFATLPDGTNYNAQTTLDAKAKNIRVVIQNTGHRPLGQK
jgi:hypothetical protein